MFGFTALAQTPFAALPEQVSYVLNASAGSYAIAGQNATFATGTLYTLTATYGTYSIAGQDASFSYTPVVLTNLETLIKLRSFTEHRRF